MISSAAMAMFTRALALAALLSPMVGVAQTAPQPASAPKISTEQAKTAALKVVPGRVTSVVIEKKQGKNVYVVEIVPRGGGEKDVFVDIETGQVLGTED
jgi:uncharacterized membrane protein YkoI